MKSIFVLIYLLVALPTVHGVELSDLLKKIKQAKEPSVEAFNGDPSEFARSIIIGVDSHDESRAATALITYWLSGEQSSVHIELIWWRSKSPMLRSLAAALLLTGRGENTSDIPWLDVTRFNTKESKEREHELNLVEQCDKQLGGALKSLIQETYSENPNKWKEALQLRFSIY